MLKRILPLTLVTVATLSTALANAADPPKITFLSTLVGTPGLTSVAGEEFRIMQFAPKSATGLSPAPAFRFLVQGGLHGNEEVASNLVLWMARRYARGQSLLNLLPRDQVAIDFLPNANPDGDHDHTRYNARGVNLNRNFGVLWGITKENPGTKSFSEPETTAIRRLFETQKYTAAVDVHGYVNWVVSPSAPEAVAAIGIKASKAQRSAYAAWVAALTSEMAVLPNYQLKTGATLGDGGAFEDWAFWSQGTFAYCLEIEGIQRFVKTYRRDFADLANEPAHSVDLFTRYEAFVYRMFAESIKLAAPGQAASLASSTPAR
jgi:hypothetical protein